MLKKIKRHDENISLQAFSETNTLLEMAGVKIPEVPQRSTVELADILEVDAVLRVTIEPKQAFTEPLSFSVDKQGLPTNQEIWVNVAEIFITAGLYDGASGVPLWSIGQDKPAEIGLKHENIARRLVEKLGKVLP